MKRPIFLLTVVFCCLSTFAQERNFSPEIKRVAVFKNGYAFTYREGESSANANWIYTTDMPVGVLGTVWGYSTTANVRVDQLLASEFLSSINSERVEDIAEFLLANEGKRIRFVDGYNVTYEGVYEILSRHRGFEAGLRTHDAYRSNYDLNAITLSLKTESGMMLVPANSVRKIEVLDASPNLLKPKKEKQEYCL